MHRIFFVVTLGVILTLSPVLVFDGVADAKGGGGASSGGSSSGNGKGKSGQSGPSNSGSSNNGASAKGAAGASAEGQSAARGSGSNTASSNARSKASGSTSGGGKGKSGKGGSSNNGAGAKGAAGASFGGQSGSSQNAASARGAAGASRGDDPPSRTAAAASTPHLAADTTNPAGLATPSAVVPGSSVARITGWRGDRVRLPGRLRPERGTERVIGRQAIQLAMTSTFGMFVPPPRSSLAACREAVISAALPLGAERVTVGGAGPVRRRGEALSTPIEVSVRYPREVRQARIECRLSGNGAVIGLH